VPKAESSLTAFHIGVVFILLGFLMVFLAMITNSMVDGDWSHLLGIGVTFIIVGLIMVMVNRIITAREEEELAKYVSQRLARTRSGYQLGRDLESHPHVDLRRQQSRRLSTKPMTRTPSTRRSIRGQQQQPQKQLERSASNHSHLAVTHNGTTSSSDAVAAAQAEVNNEAEVITETETLLPKRDNKPALVVTKETSKRPSKKRKEPTTSTTEAS